jgi:hypothetical protein
MTMRMMRNPNSMNIDVLILPKLDIRAVSAVGG